MPMKVCPEGDMLIGSVKSFDKLQKESNHASDTWPSVIQTNRTKHVI